MKPPPQQICEAEDWLGLSVEAGAQDTRRSGLTDEFDFSVASLAVGASPVLPQDAFSSCLWQSQPKQALLLPRHHQRTSDFTAILR